MNIPKALQPAASHLTAAEISCHWGMHSLAPAVASPAEGSQGRAARVGTSPAY